MQTSESKLNPDLLKKNIQKLIKLTEEEWEVFSAYLNYKSFKRKQLLVETGELVRYEYFILKGCVRAYLTDEKGVEHNIQFSVEDWWISDIGGFASGKPALLTVEALEDTDTIRIDRRSVEEIYQKIPKFERFFRLLLQNALVSYQQRLLSTISKSAEDRYVEFIEKYPMFEQRIPQVHIASFLGITPEFLSKLRKKIFARK